MDYLNLSRILVLVASIAITAGLYDQTLKIWRTKSAKDFTLSLMVALFFNELAWLNYGVALHEWPITVVGIANVPAVVIASVGYLRYR